MGYMNLWLRLGGGVFNLINGLPTTERNEIWRICEHFWKLVCWPMFALILDPDPPRYYNSGGLPDSTRMRFAEYEHSCKMAWWPGFAHIQDPVPLQMLQFRRFIDTVHHQKEKLQVFDTMWTQHLQNTLTPVNMPSILKVNNYLGCQPVLVVWLVEHLLLTKVVGSNPTKVICLWFFC